ncbi:NACHT domain-containing protein [Streptomyces umbrinus]|uniref:NACHT domain-containing protein n=1 Tax=Streptomyces umbrinus TaxID=67370 RepID=UPI003C2D3D5A
MVTGVEVAAAMLACKPVIERAAGTALGKMIPSPIGAVKNRFKNRATRKRLQAEVPSEVAAKFTAEFSQALMSYLNSTDFVSLAMSVAAHHFAEGRKKKQIAGLESAKSNLLNSLASLPGSSDIAVDSVAAGIWESLVNSITEYTNQASSSSSLPPESRAAVVRMAANFGRADVSRSDFLSDAKRLSKYHAFERALKEQVKALHSTMKLPHAGTTRRVAYSRLFVNPKFALMEQEAQKSQTFELSPPGLDDVISNSHRTVILGDPGGGKSTLSLKLTYDIARDNFQASGATLPLLVVLRDYTREFETGHSTMVQYLENLCKSPYNLNPPTGFIEYALDAGRAFVIFDGLDELIDTSLRRRVVDLVESFAYRYPMSPMLVTTRKVGYEEAPLDLNLFGAVQLAQLNDAAVRDYADKWFALDNAVDKGRRVDLANSFYRDSRFVADLTRNPLMLSLMCGIYASENYIPANRPEVYKKCAELLFDKWDKQRGILTPLPFDAHVKHAINALAYSIYSHPGSQTGLTREQVIRFVKQFLLAKRFEDEDEAENAATQFVEFCTGRAWVLSNVGSDATQELYGFTHRTFLEYFAANQLVRLNPTAELLFLQLREKIAHAEWDVVSQLALQIVGNNTDNGIDDFLERLVEESREAPFEEEVNLVAFAARSLSFAVPKPSLIRSICRASVHLALKMTQLSKSDPTPVRDRDTFPYLRGVRALLHVNSENLPSVAKGLRAELLERDGDSERAEVKLALALMFSLVRHSGMDDSSYMPAGSTSFWENFECENFDIFADRIAALSNKKYWVALQGATSGAIPFDGIIERYGPQSLFQFHVGAMIMRAPFVLRVSRSDSEVLHRVDKEIDNCVAILSTILPDCPRPWFTDPYDYVPIGGVVRPYHDGFRKPLSEVPSDHRDALILLAVAWAELVGVQDHHPVINRTEGRIGLLATKWNLARSDNSSVQYAVRSIRSYALAPRTTELLVDWVQGRTTFVGAGYREKNG